MHLYIVLVMHLFLLYFLLYFFLLHFLRIFNKFFYQNKNSSFTDKSRVRLPKAGFTRIQNTEWLLNRMLDWAARFFTPKTHQNNNKHAEVHTGYFRLPHAWGSVIFTLKSLSINQTNSIGTFSAEVARVLKTNLAYIMTCSARWRPAAPGGSRD